MKSIKIQITGAAATGKSTIGQLIEDALVKAGVSVVIIDDQPRASDTFQAARLKSLVEQGLHVDISFAQVPLKNAKQGEQHV